MKHNSTTAPPAPCRRAAPWVLAVMLLMLALAPLAPASQVHAQAPGAVTPATFFTSPLEPPTSIPTATWTPAPTSTVTATPTPTATATPTPTATYPAYQVSPLLLQPGPARTPGNDALLWIGGATLLVLAGSVILVLGRRQGEA